MEKLSEEQVTQYHEEGVLVVENVIEPRLLQRLVDDFEQWSAESQDHDAPYGTSFDGRPRFDMQPPAGDKPAALRRVQSPTEVSDAYFEVMSDSSMTDMVAELIGPDIKFHHSKINSKLPGSATEVKWHQDFPFTPHTNSDLVTALLMIDTVTEENGPLAVAPGSHKGPIHSIWQNGVFTGAVAPEIEADFKKDARFCYGPAGSVCFMHTRLAHGSEPNRSTLPRTLFIAVYSAGDAIPCAPNPLPSRHEGMFVRGENLNKIRCEAYEIQTPEFPKTSFFAQQSASERRG